MMPTREPAVARRKTGRAKVEAKKGADWRQRISMHKHIAEAFVPVPYPESFVVKVCTRYRDYCRLTDAAGRDALLDFGEARAILRPTGEGLHFRIEAPDPITFYGIRTLFQGILATTTTGPEAAVEWQPAGSVPFRAIRKCLKSRQNYREEDSLA